jgi:hypothetical protein
VSEHDARGPKSRLSEAGPLIRLADMPVNIQTTSQSTPSTPCWFGEVTVIARHLTRQGALAAISEQVRFARRRFGRYGVIDFVAVLFGYAISGERTLEAFYHRLQPFAAACDSLIITRTNVCYINSAARYDEA